MEPELPGYVTPLVRQVLAIAAGFLIGKGIVDAQTAAALSGAALSLVPVIWAMISRKATREALKNAIAAPEGMAR